MLLLIDANLINLEDFALFITMLNRERAERLERERKEEEERKEAELRRQEEER